MGRCRHMVFDIDGTLLDTEAATLSSLQALIREVQHRDAGVDGLRFALGIPGEVSLRRLGFTDTVAANARWGELLRERWSMMRPFDGIEELLRRLQSEGYALGIVTSKDRGEYASDFVPFGLSGYFGRVVCAGDAPRSKPAPDPLVAYLARCGIGAGEAVYVGDTAYDSQCARGAGVDFGLAAWGGGVDVAVEARYVFRSPADVLAALTGGRGAGLG